MVGLRVNSASHCNILVVLAIYVSSSYGLNVGFIAGDLKRLSPLVIKKFSQNSPVFINTKNDMPMRSMLDQSTDKAPVKKRSILPIPPLKLSPKFRRSIHSIPKLPYVPFILPWIPKHPLLPLFPSWLPNPSVPEPHPFVPPLAKASTMNLFDRRNSEILTKLYELKHRGSLTTSEYRNFKNLLFK